jgi:hypothetical protein
MKKRIFFILVGFFVERVVMYAVTKKMFEKLAENVSRD